LNKKGIFNGKIYVRNTTKFRVGINIEHMLLLHFI